MRVLWQAFIALLIALGFGYMALSLSRPNDVGDFGFSGHPIANATIAVDDVDARGVASAAGVRKGDRLEVRRTLNDRIATISPETGDHLTVRINGGARPIELVAKAATNVIPVPLAIAFECTRVAFLLMAGLIAWKRSDDPAARSLATFLAFYGVALTVGVDLQQISSLWARFVSFLLVEAMYFAGAAAVLSFACRFPDPAKSGWRRRVEQLVIPVVVLGIAFSWTRLALEFFGDVPFQDRTLLLLPYTLTYIAVLTLSCVTLVLSYRALEGAARVRMRLILITFTVGFSGLVVYFGAISLGIRNDALQFGVLTVPLIPFGLAYGILRHRVFDIGFVVNRAVVYTSVSLVIVASFILFEWILGHVVEQRSNTGVFLNLSAALVLGLSTRFIHDRVDRYIDDLFFRQRHLAEEAIRRFAHEAALITNTRDLITKTVDTAQQHVNLAYAAFYGRRGDSYVPIESTAAGSTEIDENDYAVLSMRTWHQSVDLLERRSALLGEVAFPMVVRGSLTGFLLCGPKNTHEAIAPDERAALAVLARDAGIALDSLRVRRIERELAELEREGHLPATLLDRLGVTRATGGEEFAL